MKNSDYWKLRFEQLEEAQYGKAKIAFSQIEQQYKQTQKQLEGQITVWFQQFANNNGITLAEAHQCLKSADLKEFKWDVQDYIKYGKENAINEQWVKQLENAYAKFHISKLDALKIQTQQSLEVMFSKQLGAVKNTMQDVFKSSYYHTAYELQKGFNIGWDIAGLNQSEIEKVLAKPWAVDGKNFFERICNNKAKLISEVHNELTQNIMLGGDPQKAIDSIAKKMNYSRYNARRLIMTEEAYFSSAAQRDCFYDLDIEQYEIVATLDSHTSDMCRSLDGKVFPLKEFKPGITAPPFHVFCRSTTVPHFDQNFSQIGERAARNPETGKTYYVPADMTYLEWKEKFVKTVDIQREHGIIRVGSDKVTGVIKIEKEYGIPYGKYSVNADLNYINSDEFAEKFNKVTDITAVNKTLLNCSRAAINHRNNSLYEDMYIINGHTGEIMGQQLNAAYEEGINHNESIKLALLKAKSEKIPIVAFHSHPEGYPPSIDDFNSAYKYEYLLGVVCGHNGQVYTYKNNIGYIENADDLHQIISNAILGGFDVDRAYREAYEVIGLKYEIIKE